MKNKILASIVIFSLLFWILFITLADVLAQDNRRFFIGAAGGYGIVTANEYVLYLPYEQVETDDGLMFEGSLGYQISPSFFISVEYSVAHPNNERPQISDIKQSAGYKQDFQLVRNPKVFKTTHLQVCLKIFLSKSFFVKPGLGLAWNDSETYPHDQNEISGAFIYTTKSPSLGLAAGYETIITSHFRFSLEGVVRLSISDPIFARLVSGIQAGFLWFF